MEKILQVIETLAVYLGCRRRHTEEEVERVEEISRSALLEWSDKFRESVKQTTNGSGPKILRSESSLRDCIEEAEREGYRSAHLRLAKYLLADNERRFPLLRLEESLKELREEGEKIKDDAWGDWGERVDKAMDSLYRELDNIELMYGECDVETREKLMKCKEDVEEWVSSLRDLRKRVGCPSRYW